jgi:hypothetical protein
MMIRAKQLRAMTPLLEGVLSKVTARQAPAEYTRMTCGIS